MLKINSNLSSLNAQNQLTQTGRVLSTTSLRLASGLRINGAADDAAGLSIQQNMTSQIRGIQKSVQNLMPFKLDFQREIEGFGEGK